MSMRAEQHLNGFLDALAHAGLAMSLIRRSDFLRAMTLTDLLSVEDLYWTGRITTVSRVEDIDTYDQIFSVWFKDGKTVLEETVEQTDESESDQPPEMSTSGDAPSVECDDGTGQQASPDELLTNRRLPQTGPEKREICRRIARTAASVLPRQRARRLARSPRHGVLDMRRVVSHLRRSDGEIIDLFYRKRPLRLRRVLMLIDVSGSLKTTSPDALRCAHALMQAAPQMEVFTFGTRLTRVTRTLARGDIDDALQRLSDVIYDFDGGTRIGPSFEAFLGENRLQTLARGALVIVVSDGLERGDISAMQGATERLARLAHRLVWLTPLMGDPAFRPETRGLKAVLGAIDRLGNAATLGALCDEISGLDEQVERRARRGVASRWMRPVPVSGRPDDTSNTGRVL
ncbi:VWA domain-containing protein [uncultured Martelella sp.]|uniref:vWA domain-containing protein n=1 Tax=uncultured Martelella sp. TaxID=392331 RepID=UPI0029C868F5|nr:VWA domain-containing protein [uncultured Martelella sp.]